MHDLIYLCVVIQTGFMFTRWASLVVLVVSAYVSYFAFSSGLISGNDSGWDEADGKGVHAFSVFPRRSGNDRREAQR